VLGVAVLLAASCTSRAPTPVGAAESGAAAAPAQTTPARSPAADAATPAPAAAPADPLPSWNAGAAKDAIVAFVARVTRQDGPDFVPPSERIATFDNDGTLWSEQPIYVQLAYLRANSFKTFIVSGGGADFIRPWAGDVYGIPPEQVVGSRAKLEYEVRDGVPRIERLAGVDFVDDKAGKPVGIQEQIGQRPIAAFGNSDGDFEMLEWTTSGPGPRLGMIVHHTDISREWAYDRASPIGRLARALDEAPKRGWVVIDMKQDWKVVYSFDQ
jgi:hypothetical protein